MVNQGHFYAWANKEGTLCVKTSGYEPWEDYEVQGWWLDKLWTQHKLSHSQYIEYAALVRLGFQNRQRQAQSLIDREARRSLEGQQAQVAEMLRPLRKPFRDHVLAQLSRRTTYCNTR